MFVVVLIGTIFVIGISSLVIDTILEKKSYHKAMLTPKYHKQKEQEEDVSFIINITDDDNESYTVL